MREINRSAILEIIRERSPLSQTEISQVLDVSLPTVMRIVKDLLEEDVIRELDDTQWSGGRRRSLIEFNSQGKVVIGVDLGGTKMYGAVATLAGDILNEISVNAHNTKGDESYRRLVELISDLLDQAKKTGKQIYGIGVGVPGVTQSDKGIVDWAPNLKWRDFPLREKLEEDFGFPVIVENDVNLAALGELWFGAGKEVQNMVLLFIGTGMGAGIIIERTLFSGSHNSAGEIGYMLPSRDCLGKSYEGIGPLELVASGTGIADIAREILYGKRSSKELESITAEDIFIEARNGEEWANQLVMDTVDYIALTIININALFDPDIIVLGGGIVQSEDLILPTLYERIKSTGPHTPSIIMTTLGKQAAVMGTIIKVIYKKEKHFDVRTRS